MRGGRQKIRGLCREVGCALSAWRRNIQAVENKTTMSTEDFIKLSDDGVAPLIYIAGPYGDKGGFNPIEFNAGVARTAVTWLVREGFYTLCPHLNTLHFEVITPEISIAHWYAQDLRLMETCDAMIVVGKWQTSKGVAKELEVAKEKGMPVFDFTTEEGVADLRAWREAWVIRKLDVEPLVADDVVASL